MNIEYRHTLYLDFYPAIPNPKTGKPTHREFLKLYLYDKPRTPIERNENIETLKMAEMKRFQRYNDLNKPEIYTDVERDQLKQKEIGELSFTEYFNKEVSKRNADHNIWVSFSNHLQNFAGQDLKFSDITEKFCNDFRQYLLSAIVKKTKKPLCKGFPYMKIRVSPTNNVKLDDDICRELSNRFVLTNLFGITLTLTNLRQSNLTTSSY